MYQQTSRGSQTTGKRTCVLGRGNVKRNLGHGEIMVFLAQELNRMFNLNEIFREGVKTLSWKGNKCQLMEDHALPC